MENREENIISLRFVRILFETLDDHYDKKILEIKEWRDRAQEEHSEYIESARKSMEEMGDDYDYGNYDYGVDQELAFEALGAEKTFKFFNEIKDLQLLSLYEMKVLFLYKEVEIRLKTTISDRYNKSTKKLSNLEKICDFFDSKSISLKNIEFFKEIDDLRLVANDLKHSIKINQSKSVSEFSSLSEFDYPSIKKFMDKKIYEVEYFFSKLFEKINYAGKVGDTDDALPF